MTRIRPIVRKRNLRFEANTVCGISAQLRVGPTKMPAMGLALVPTRRRIPGPIMWWVVSLLCPFDVPLTLPVLLSVVIISSTLYHAQVGRPVSYSSIRKIPVATHTPNFLPHMDHYHGYGNTRDPLWSRMDFCWDHDGRQDHPTSGQLG